MHSLYRVWLLFGVMCSLALLGACNSVAETPAPSNAFPPLSTVARATNANSQTEATPRATAAKTQTRSATRAPTATRPKTVNGFKTIARAELPSQAIKTLTLIQKGGPYPYRQDGQVFQNREGILPKKAQGYYHEYTVETPGSDDRGARRIVTGNNGEYYYTDDHYSSFKIIIDP